MILQKMVEVVRTRSVGLWINSLTRRHELAKAYIRKYPISEPSLANSIGPGEPLG
jgi:hypothetical protein